jgi:hypothetical protein
MNMKFYTVLTVMILLSFTNYCRSGNLVQPNKSETLKRNLLASPGVNKEKFLLFIDYGFAGLIEQESMANRFLAHFTGIYKIGNYFNVGLGTGFKYFFQAEQSFIPLFGQLRFDIETQITNFFIAARGGTMIHTTNFQVNGYVFNALLGFSISLSEDSDIYLGLGLDHQDVFSGLKGNYYVENSVVPMIVLGHKF